MRSAGTRNWSTLEMLSPVLVRGNTVLGFNTYDGGLSVDVVEFTPSGELLITEHTISR